MASSNSKEKETDHMKLFPLSTGAYLEQLHNLWTTKTLCDAVVTADGRKFEVHRVVLAAASKYFERVFSSEAWIEYRTGQVTLDGISALSLEIILKSVYTQELQLSPEIVLGVLEAAHRLEFSEVFKCCESYIEEIVAPPNCLDYLLAGETYNMNKVLHSSEKCLLDNFSIVSLQDKFLQMSGEALKNYIRNDSLQCESEMDVFRSVVRWLKFDAERKEKATMLMRHVRFGLMGSSSLLGPIWKEPIMTSNVTCQEMLRKAIEYCSKPNDQPFVKEEWCTPRNTKSWLVVIGGNWDQTRCLTPPVVLPFDNPRSEIWSIDDNLKPFSTTYRNAGAGVCLNHYLYITGGIHVYPASSNDSFNEAHSNTARSRLFVANAIWRFNSVELKCEQMTNMLVARKHHTAFLHRETIIVAGGKNDNKKSLSSTEIYSIKDNSWELGPYMQCGLLHLAGCSYKDQAYISGGFVTKKNKEFSIKKFFKYDTILKDWIEKSPMIHERCEHVLCSTSVGVFAVGGRKIYRNRNHGYDSSVHHITKPEFYDPAANQWTIIKADIDIRSCKASSVVQNNKIYILGGLVYEDNQDNRCERLAQFKCFNTETKTIEKMPSKLPFRIQDSVMAILPLPSNKDDEDQQQDRGEDDDLEANSDSSQNRNANRSRSNSPDTTSSSSYGGGSYQYYGGEESSEHYYSDASVDAQSDQDLSDSDY